MFGCIGRLVVLAVVVALGATAYLTRDRWEPRVRARLGLRPSRAATFAWEPIEVSGAARIRASLDSLNRPSGPAFVNVRAGDLVAFAIEPVARRLLAAQPADGRAAARAVENLLYVRGHVTMADLGGAAALGPLAGVLEGTQPVELRGRIEVPEPGKGVFIVTRIALGELSLPAAVIGRVVQQIAPRSDTSLAEDAVALALPRGVGDVRLTRGRVTLYKSGQ